MKADEAPQQVDEQQADEQQTLVAQTLDLLAIASEMIARFFFLLVLGPLLNPARMTTPEDRRKWIRRFMRCEAMLTRATQVAARRLAGLPDQHLPLSHYMPVWPASWRAIRARWHHLCFRIDARRDIALRMAAKMAKAAERAALPVAVALAGDPLRTPDQQLVCARLGLAAPAVTISLPSGLTGARGPP